jgi:cysteine desulfurase
LKVIDERTVADGDLVRTPIYLDHHATTPVDPAVLEAMLPYFTQEFGNASSVDHVFGRRAETAVEQARHSVAELIGARESEIVFTSGATEADNLALLGVAESLQDRGDHIITAVTEHSAVLDALRWLEQQGKRVTYLPVDRYGLVEPDAVRRAITDRTILISIMAANNEIGTIAPIAAIGSVAREHGVLFHTDATQAVGHIPIDVEAMHIDLLSLSAHKFYGPKGVGALYVRRRNPRVKLAPIIRGGGHERGLRSGTLNVPGIVGLGKAGELSRRTMTKEAERVKALGLMLYRGLATSLDDVELNGHPDQRLPHSLNIFIPGVEAKSLILQVPEVAFSTGAACSTARVEPSHVLQALQLGPDRPYSSIRLGLGRSTTEREVRYVVERLGAAARLCRAVGRV